MTSPTSPRAARPHLDRPLSNLRASIVGSGRVGESLAHWLRSSGAEIVFLSGRRPPAPPLLERLRTTYRPLDALSAEGQDLLLIATPDGTVARVAESLARRPQAKVALHVSGALDAEVLASLRQAGCAIGTLHPLRAFAQPSQSTEDAGSTFFALDGDADAVELGRRLADAWRGSAAVVPAKDRILYHFAATLAAGGVVTLLAIAADIARRLELPPTVVEGYLDLARGALHQAGEVTSPEQALTGPAARRDTRALARQRRQLQQQMPHLLPLFESLTEETQRLLETCHPAPSSATIPPPDSGIGERPPRAS